MKTEQEGAAEGQELNEIRKVRRQKLQELRQTGNDPYQTASFPKTHTNRQIAEGFAELENKRVCVAGRIVSKRIMGKASFAHIYDASGKLQLYVRRDVVGEEAVSYTHLTLPTIYSV